MKKTLALLAAMLLAVSINAAPIVSSTLGADSEAAVSPLVVAPDLSSAQSVSMAQMSGGVSYSVIPEPTTFSLVLASLAVVAGRKLRHRHSA